MKIESAATTFRCQSCGVPLTGQAQFCSACASAAFDAAIDDTGLQFPGYEHPELISRGGMGVVYRAHQLRPAREVALKVLLTHLADDVEMQARFHIEARAMAALQHPAILPIYEVGDVDGMPFFSMMLATGGSLSERLMAGPLAPRDAASLMAGLCRALHHAHQQGVLHRDLKPANFLFDQAGRAYITDFGLAKLVITSPAEALTQVDSFFGTPHYMPPEVASGSVHGAATPADIYSMGAVLYQCLSGQRPFGERENLAALLRTISEEKVPPLRTLDPKLPRDLEVICARAMEPEPASRYASAADLADDLERWLDGRPIQARPVGAVERVLRWARRHPLPASLAAALLGTALIGSVLLVASHREQGRLLDESNLRLGRSLLDQARAERLLGEPGHRDRSLDLLRQAAEISPSPEIRNEAAALLVRPDVRAVPKPKEAPGDWPTLLDPEDTATSRSISSDGTQALSFHERSGRAAAWKAGTPTPVAVWNPPPGRAITGGMMPDGKGAILADTERGIILLSADLLDVRTLLPAGGPAVTGIAIHPAGESVALGLADGLSVVRISDGSSLWQAPGLRILCAPAWSPDGLFLAVAAAGEQQGVSLHEARTGSRGLTIPTRGWPIRIAMQPGGHLLAIADDEHALTLAEVATGRIWANLTSTATDLRFSDDGKHLFAGRKAWQIQTPTAFREWRGSAEPGDGETVSSLALSPDGRHLLTTATRGVRLWDVATGKQTGFHLAENQRIDAPTSAWWVDGNRILVQVPGGLEQVSIGSDGSVAGVEKVPRPPGCSIVNIDPTGAWLVRMTDEDESISYESWPAGDSSQAVPAEAPSLANPQEKIRSDGRLTATCAGRELLLIPPQAATFQSAVVSADGGHLFALSTDHRVLVWNLKALAAELAAEGVGGE